MRPLDLPAVREALCRTYSASPDDAIGAVSAFQRGLREATLFWAAQDVVDIARDVAGREITEHRWVAEDRPAPSGFLVAEGGLSELPVWRSTSRAPTQAITWAPHPDGLELLFLVHRSAVDDLRSGHRSGPPLPPLVVNDGLVVPVQDSWQPLGTVTLPIVRRVVAEVQACWALLRAPVVETAPATPDSAPPTPRRSRPEPPVTVIQLRRAQPTPARGEHAGRWRHRWVVRMHPRWQAYGPGRSQRRRVLVGPYVKGPAGAPLLHREHVHLWR